MADHSPDSESAERSPQRTQSTAVQSSPKLPVLRPVDFSDFEGKYEYLQELGSGGMGSVFKARHRALRNLVAIKVLHPHLMNDASVTRFQREAEAASTIKSANVAKVVDLGLTESGRPYSVMEFIEGRSLAEALQQEGSFGLTRAMQLALQMCDAVSAIHSYGILHRDLKPANIMLIRQKGGVGAIDEQIKIIDFGIAKFLDAENVASVTQTGDIFGSPAYMSPEQIEGKPPTAQTDIYSLGCVIFEMLTGSPPQIGSSLLQTISMHANEDAPKLSQACTSAKIIPQFDKFMAKCLARSTKTRYKDMSEVRHDLVDLLKRLNIAYLSQSLDAHSVSHHAKIPAIVIGAISLISVVVIGFLIWNPNLPNHVVSNSMPSKTRNSRAEAIDAAPAAQAYVPSAVTVNPEVDEVASLAMPMGDPTKDLVLNHSKNDGPDGGCVVDLHKRSISFDEFEKVCDFMKKESIKNIRLRGVKEGSDSFCQTLGAMPGLTEIEIDSSSITNQDVASLCQSKDLRWLEIPGNRLVTNEAIPSICKLPKLQKLDISNRSQVKVAEVFRTPLRNRLTYLAANLHKLDDEDMKILGSSSLKGLAIYGNSVTAKGLSSLVPLQLTELKVGSNSIGPEGLKEISKMKSLRVLYINQCNLTDEDLKPLVKLRNLECINIAGNPALTDSCLDTIAKLPQLKRLYMRDLRVDAESLRKLDKIDLTELSFAKLDAETLRDLQKVHANLMPAPPK